MLRHRASLSLVAALAALWLPVVWLLGAQWSISEQYRYGWAVPFLSIAFAWRRAGSSEKPGLASNRFEITAAVALFLLLFPALVLQHANPLWRLASYALVGIVAGLTLLLLCIIAGKSAARVFAFPVLFFFVAVPWPSPIEQFMVQTLTSLNVSIVVEALQLLGLPAAAHGNVIEVPAGFVGVEEACSGIRSMQAVLMLSLAFGEWNRRGVSSRFALVGIGVLTAFVLNGIRTITLASLTAFGGSALAARWHDFTGVALLLGCFTLVWWFAARKSPPAKSLELSSVRLAFKPNTALAGSLFLFGALAAALATEFWFRIHEQRQTRSAEWQVRFPEQAPGFRELPVSDYVRANLLFDRSATASWETRGMKWVCFYFRWFPAANVRDRVRSQLAKSHRPEICLPSGGRTLVAERAPIVAEVAGERMPFRVIEFNESGAPLFVFYTVLEDGTRFDTLANMRESHRSRWLAAWHGNRGLGQRVLEMIVSRAPDLPTAEAAFRAQLSSLVTSASR
jgi:exosortase